MPTVQSVEQWLNEPGVQRVMVLAIVLIVILVAMRLLRGLIARQVQDTAARYRLRKATSFAAFLVAALAASSIFSDRLSGLTVAFGVAGAGVAFALQEVIASVAGFLAVSVGGFYRPGDRVQLGGITGDVIDIGVLRTTLMELGDWVDGDLYNGRMVRVANSFVFKAPVYNYSADFPFLWDEIAFTISFQSDREWVRSQLAKIAEEVVGEYTRDAADEWKRVVRRFMIEDANIEPAVSLVATDGGVRFTLRYIVDYKQRRSTKNALYGRVLDALAASEGKAEIATPMMQIQRV